MISENNALLLIKEIYPRTDELTEWESDFVADIEDWILNNKNLTEPQCKTLNRIYEKATANG